MSNLEVEIKAYCSDLNKIENYLTENNAVFIKKRVEKDTYYNHPARDFGQTDEALRVRSVDGSTILTYKGEKLSKKSKARVEEEIKTDDEKSLHLILKHLGFIEAGFVKKERRYFSLEGIEICLDSVKNLGDFVELECKGENIEDIERRLFALAEKMGLSDFETRSYLELIFFS